MADNHQNVNPDQIAQPGPVDDKAGDNNQTPLGLNREEPMVDTNKLATSVNDQEKLWQVKQ